MSAKSLNKVMLIGNLTRDPEIKVTPSGASVCTFGLATNSRYKKPDGNYEELTNFHNIVAWSKLAEICAKKLRKGMKVYVEGELRTRRWEDDTNQKKQRTEVRITEMIVIKDKGYGEGAEEDMEVEHEDHAELAEVTADYLPF
jgi:single-strand DNA-binding protein